MGDWQDHITIDQNVCHGKPCVRGTRIMVSVVLDNLAEGLTPEKIVAEYPPLTLEDVRATLAYAVALDRVVAAAKPCSTCSPASCVSER